MGLDTVGKAASCHEGLEGDNLVDVAADLEGRSSRPAAAVEDGTALVTEMIDIALEGQVHEDSGGFSAHEVGKIHGEPFDRAHAYYRRTVRLLEKDSGGLAVSDVCVR